MTPPKPPQVVIRIDQETGAISVEDENEDKLQIVGDLYSADRKEAKRLRELRDNFDDGVGSRFIPVPLELWEKKGNSICYVRVGGILRRRNC